MAQYKHVMHCKLLSKCMKMPYIYPNVYTHTNIYILLLLLLCRFFHCGLLFSCWCVATASKAPLLSRAQLLPGFHLKTIIIIISSKYQWICQTNSNNNHDHHRCHRHHNKIISHHILMKTKANGQNVPRPRRSFIILCLYDVI